jgi:hypothetical protein
MYEYRFASTVWMDVAITSLTLEPTLDAPYFLTQYHNLPPSSLLLTQQKRSIGEMY